MNKTITSLSLIADAAEYQDRNTSAAWRIRSTLSSIAVWTANSFLSALKTDNSERIFNAAVKLATVRVWMRDCNSSSFVLDLTPTGVANTLGVDREVDVHVEAERIARQKCKAVLSAKRFKEYYTRAKESLLEQQAQRKERVESITELLSDQSMSLTQDVRDYASTFHGLTLGQTVADEDLYDDNSVERESDRLNETVAPVTSDDSITDKFVGWTANRIDALATGSARLFGAAQASGKNFEAHRKLEHAVQSHRSQQRLQLAAERAARILNS